MEESSIEAQAYNLSKVLRECVKQLQHTLALKCHHRIFSSLLTSELMMVNTASAVIQSDPLLYDEQF